MNVSLRNKHMLIRFENDCIKLQDYRGTLHTPICLVSLEVLNTLFQYHRRRSLLDKPHTHTPSTTTPFHPKAHSFCPFTLLAHLLTLTNHSKVLSSLPRSATLIRVKLGYNWVGWVAYNGTEHTSNVSSRKRHNQLLGFAECVPRYWHHMLVEELNCPLKCSKLHHSIGNLTHPERREPLKEPAIISCHLWRSYPEMTCGLGSLILWTMLFWVDTLKKERKVCIQHIQHGHLSQRISRLYLPRMHLRES